jgi:hypothetical protein
MPCETVQVKRSDLGFNRFAFHSVGVKPTLSQARYECLEAPVSALMNLLVSWLGDKYEANVMAAAPKLKRGFLFCL